MRHPLSQFEEKATLYSMSGVNVGEPVKTKLATISGIIDFNQPKLNSGRTEAIPQFVTATIHFNRPSTSLSTLKLGDWFTTEMLGEDVIFEIVYIDLLGRLPGGYPNRISGERR